MERLCRPAILAMLLALVAAGRAAPARGHVAGSAEVAALQVALAAADLYRGAIDGVAGAGTRTAVRALQARAGLPADGVAGRRTRRALGTRGRPPLGSRAIAVPARGWDVAALQFLLARAGFPSGGFDGVAGPRMQRALRRFQAWAGLAADGVAGPATLAALRRPAPASPLRLLRPASGALTGRFGPRGAAFHSGVDFDGPTGAPVLAAGRGCVRFAGWGAGGYGNLVVLQHRLGVTTWYAHLSSVAVRPGDCVAAGRRLASVGATGRARGSHLHFEVRVRGAAVDPLGAL